ncbi:unnamed protein product [Closterium sp. NIES-53]
MNNPSTREMFPSTRGAKWWLAWLQDMSELRGRSFATELRHGASSAGTSVLKPPGAAGGAGGAVAVGAAAGSPGGGAGRAGAAQSGDAGPGGASAGVPGTRDTGAAGGTGGAGAAGGTRGASPVGASTGGPGVGRAGGTGTGGGADTGGTPRGTTGGAGGATGGATGGTAGGTGVSGARRQESFSPLQLREWAVRWGSPSGGAGGSGGAVATRAGVVPSTHCMALHPSSVPKRIVLLSPPASSLPHVPDPESDLVRAASPTVTRLLAIVVTDPSFESAATSALVVELVDFAALCHLDYAASLVFYSSCPPSVEGELALGCDVLEDRQFELECLAAAAPHLASMLLCPEGDPDALDIPTPRSYAEAITGAYVDEVPPPGANIVDDMWIFKVKRSPCSPPAFKARYVARGFRQREGVDFFQTFFPTPKMTTLRVLLHVAAQRDYELHSLDFSTAFLQSSLHETIWLRHPRAASSCPTRQRAQLPSMLARHTAQRASAPRCPVRQRAPLPNAPECPAARRTSLPLPAMATTTVLRQQQPSVQESLSPQQLREWAIWWGSPDGGASRACERNPLLPQHRREWNIRWGATTRDTTSAEAEPEEALHIFTLDSGASRCLFRDSTTVTPLTVPVPVTLADPSGGLIVALGATVLPCPAAPSGLLTGLHLPSFAKNLVATSVLQDQWVTITQPGGELVAICMDSRTGEHLATFTRRPGPGLYTLTTGSALEAESGQVAATGQVAASVEVAASCSCRLLTHQTLLWHHRLGHPSLQCLQGMHSRLLISGPPRSLPPLPRSLAPPCLPCVEGRQRAAPHSPSFPPTRAPLRTLHIDVWGPA